MNNILLVLGASSEMGLDLIRNLDEKCLIIAHYNSSDAALNELAAEIDNDMVTIKADFSSEQETIQFLDQIETEHGIPNKIVHLSAPKFENIRFKDIQWNQMQKEFNISFRSLVLVLNRFLPKLAKEKRGKVVCMLSSVTLNVPPKALSQYTTVKYALLGLVKSLASEFADKNIQINAISPSMVETSFLEKIDERIVAMTAENHPLKRNGTVSDITPIIKMLISKDSDYLNGINVPLTGGSVF